MSALLRRRWERYRKELDVVITSSGGTTVRGRTQDLCEGGLGVVCDDLLSVGGDYGFTIAEVGDTPLVGTVRWCTAKAASAGNLIGVEFTGLSKAQAEALADRIARWRSEDAPAEDA